MSAAFWFITVFSILFCAVIYYTVPEMFFASVCGVCLALLLNGMADIKRDKGGDED